MSNINKIKETVLTLILLLPVFILAGCDDKASVDRANTNVPNINVIGNNNLSGTTAPNVNLPISNAENIMSDAENFLNKAAEDGMFEIKAGQLAASKAQNAQVKQFGQEMNVDHTKADEELKQLTQKKSVSLPTEISAEQKQKLDKLSGLSGGEFDREYMKMMVEAHQKAVDLFRDQADTGADPDIKAFAAKTLPTLKNHLEKAKNINGKLK